MLENVVKIVHIKANANDGIIYAHTVDLLCTCTWTEFRVHIFAVECYITVQDA